MKYEKDAAAIIAAVGGEENISSLYHCVTRLRFGLKDNTKADQAALTAIGPVVGVNDAGSQYQVIIGNDVPLVHKAIVAELPRLASSEEGAADASAGTKGGKQKLHTRFFDFISGVFAPILPAIAGAGLLKGVLALINAFGWVDPSSQTFLIFSAIADAVFFFLPIVVAVSAARKLNANPYVAASLGAVLVYPALTTMLSAGEPVALLGVTVTSVSYAYSVIPVLLGVYLMSWAERLFTKIIPSFLKLTFVPMLTLVTVVPITLVALGPLGTFVGNGVAGGINWALDNGGAPAGFVIGALLPLIIMTGMHYALVPFILQNLATLGYDKFLPLTYVQTFATAGAVFGVFLRAKNAQIKALSLSTTFTALMGVTEPALYGLALPLRRPLIASMAGAGVGGAISLGFGVQAYVLAGNGGLPGLPGLVGATFGWAILGIVLAFIVSTVVSAILGIDESILAKASQTVAAHEKPAAAATAASAASTTDAPLAPSSGELIASPMAGELIPLDDVPDKTFSQRLVGDGAAIRPTSGHVTSPVTGEVVTVFPTKHAVAIRSDQGTEVLIHIGIDTVSLQGRGFEAHVAEGDRVTIGDPLIDVDLDAVSATNDTVTVIVITNLGLRSIVPGTPGTRGNGDALMHVLSTIDAEASHKEATA
ncbi:PTS beta-glucoside transporter subunit EIIBCA [Pseudoclavibacter sp. RFBJ3]|uniref:beta-glucoside-specific PTS transporter subunit IIABC n=1 Tax=unclassified Pseudoclavibacter TaxID=2615177 RepID=UPI000CE84108|nr:MULTISPECIES: beta-glucoside-specific PTS transporter subunit IIABC [unclassified Pseudoclavibacter]PPF34546.1 PTS beta-glucoside transporter subunit EIIBCA [Pseudoclavibacter sp. AY1H1]PPF79904.1 PTS beta-glucoside transporter subunit EIIBCA [Pseudoclavibacter sp. RFBJ5]PPF88969.1 PTS beta-glucoside transporter subunit EIIBCA [Pseudoclavibacter sp. RFBJ3]PPG00539.1 PTS beta-glucoside transporter subunit EIIBCA [Pseudoclavibacter sp. RFBH5]PPG18304.1 PTS beta-glucoside transporter subunit E